MAENATSSRGPGVVVPPPLIFVSFLAFGIGVDVFLTQSTTSLPAMPRYALSLVLGVAGVALVGWALGLFRRAGTPPEPWQPSSALVVEGVYGYTRNPMYLGMSALYAALALVFDSPAALLLGIPLCSLSGRP